MTRRGFVGGRALDALLSPPDEDLVAVPLEVIDQARRADRREISPGHMSMETGERKRRREPGSGQTSTAIHDDGCRVAPSCLDCPLPECILVSEAQPERPPVCSVEGCEKARHTRGWCETHYLRWRKHGDPLVVRRKGRKTAVSCPTPPTFMRLGFKPQHTAPAFTEDLSAFREAELRNGRDYQGSKRTAEDLGIELGEVFRLRGRCQVEDGEVRA